MAHTGVPRRNRSLPRRNFVASFSERKVSARSPLRRAVMLRAELMVDSANPRACRTAAQLALDECGGRVVPSPSWTMRVTRTKHEGCCRFTGRVADDGRFAATGSPERERLDTRGGGEGPGGLATSISCVASPSGVGRRRGGRSAISWDIGKGEWLQARPADCVGMMPGWS